MLGSGESDHDVLRLEVAVDDALAVHFLEGQHDRGGIEAARVDLHLDDDCMRLSDQSMGPNDP